jgi:hypothetical protein
MDVNEVDAASTRTGIIIAGRRQGSSKLQGDVNTACGGRCGPGPSLSTPFDLDQTEQTLGLNRNASPEQNNYSSTLACPHREDARRALALDLTAHIL